MKSLSGFLILCAGLVSVASAGKKPKILLILADDIVPYVRLRNHQAVTKTTETQKTMGLPKIASALKKSVKQIRVADFYRSRK